MRLTFTPRNIFACTAAVALGLTTVAPGQDDPIQDRLSPGANASANADADTGESFEDNGTQADADVDANAGANTDTGANADADVDADVRANNRRNRGNDDRNRDGRDGRNQRPGDDDREDGRNRGDDDRDRDGRRDRDDDRRGDRDGNRRGDWIRFGADFDGDGEVDGWEEFYYDDYEELRRRSRDRARRDGRRPFRGNYSANRPGFGPDARREMDRRGDRRRETLRGEIRDIRYDTLNGVEGECMIARVRTEDGRTARVCLGPRTQLRRLDLSDGDRITVYGHPGHINDRAMFFASQVNYDGSQLQVNMPKAPSLKRVRGEIVSTRKAKFRGISERHVLANVELVSGREETMNLGPESKIRRLNLRDGDDISALVRPGRVNGEFAMIAEQVRHDGQTVELPRPQDRSRFGNSDRSQSGNRSRFDGNRSRFDDDRSRFDGNRNRYDDSRNREDDSRDRYDARRPNYDARRQNDDRSEFRGPNPAARNDAEIDGDISAGLGILLRHTDDQGVEIVRVVPNSPAANADLQKGDTLISIDGQPVSTYQDVTRILRDFDANERVTVRVRRNDRLRAASVRLSPRSDLFDEQN
ncbi:Putative serine protease HtrA [Maioricimonas rarisocia]|uniref:Serine protease HtrA n=1 Tax=Maioricimonas rarisocia TaxID=2528026 RepID=A0A517Z5X6_9PLAN|nr:PDZ domain-containing protein [Maioricimonas rarisocia]QDU37854.1 Putative serine protease HtrA [Maioricimonas rarisocia]